MIELINEPWPWYIAGPLIGLFVPLLLLTGNKRLGISSNFKHLCATCFPLNTIDFFKYNWKEHAWNLFFVLGIIFGGIIVSETINLDYEILINEQTKIDLAQFGVVNFNGFFPKDLFNWDISNNIFNTIVLSVGGLFVGFGTRYANGCTSGHAIMGLSSLRIDSLIAVVGFLIGGLLMTHILYPLIF